MILRINGEYWKLLFVSPNDPILYIGNGFTLERFDEYPSWENEKLPGEFTAIAVKSNV